VPPQRRIALVSVAAAAVLVLLKLAAGLASGSLGLVSEAAHSGTDLVAALLTLFAVGVAIRPADRAHPYGHGKAEHLAALAEGAILVGISLLVASLALGNLVGGDEPGVEATWYAFAVIGLVIAVDASRALVSTRASRRYRSPAFAANALHFAGDLAGSVAVLVGLAFTAWGYPKADSAAALFVAALVLAAAARLMRRNVDVLMDRAPADAQEAARRAIARIEPPVTLRRLRMRQAAGRHFMDVVIGVPAGAAVGQGHAAADAVEEAVQRALPESDVVVHVEPDSREAALGERASAAALGIPRVREVHNVRVVSLGDANEVSLHVKLPGDLTLEQAHDVASQVERAIADELPEVVSVLTHLEPIREAAPGSHAAADHEAAAVRGLVLDATGKPPRELRFVETPEGLVVYVALALDPASSLADAHERASEIEERIRAAVPVADVVVHTEPAAQRPVREADQWRGSGGTGRFPQRQRRGR
jgi:cation diffusion facilitator family transporter